MTSDPPFLMGCPDCTLTWYESSDVRRTPHESYHAPSCPRGAPVPREKENPDSFTRAVSIGAITSFGGEVFLGETRWVVSSRNGVFPVALTTCPFCDAPVRDVNR